MRRALSAAAVLVACAMAMHAGALAPASTNAFESANDAWQRGDYSTAITAYIQILEAPGGETFLESIALTTGELFESRELTDNGRAARFSPDGRYIVYETGLETSRRTRILKNDATRAEVADLPGVSATFSTQLAEVAYLRIPDNDEIRRASEALEHASLTAQNRNQLTQTLTWLVAKHAAIVVRDLASGREMELPAPDLLKTALTFSADGRLLYFLGGQEAEPNRTDLYVISEAMPKPVLVADVDGLKGPPIVDPAGKVLMYVVPTQSPLRKPVVAAPAAGAAELVTAGARGTVAAGASAPGTSAPGVSGAATQGGGGRGAAGPPATFGVVDLASRKASLIAGTAPALSGDGKTLAYIGRSGPEYALMVGPTRGGQSPIKIGTQRLDAPALSADGSRVAYQVMVRDDWEIFTAARDGSNEQQITRDIQHDVLPRFVGPDRILAIVGEPRHRRSYLYDLGSDVGPDRGQTGVRPRSVPIRLFHNNTVRTIAPEYQWAPSPDGTQILIGAERDGDTVSPARGVYAVDLQHKFGKSALLTRLRANLRSETALKASGTHAFQPIAVDVRRVLARASAARIFEYEKALFDFDSKHIAKPGNRLAAEYLFNAYKSFGYRPEYQSFDARAALGGKTSNVVATLRGTVNPELVYVVSSHFDSVEAGAGADDDTSGTAALLEAARVLADHPMPATIVFASFTGEEGGLLGSREFVRRAVAAKTKVVGALNNDMIGWTNDQRLDNTIRYSNSGIRDIQHGAAMLFTRLITYDAQYFKGTDAASLYDAYGDVIGGIGSYPVLSSPHYHQASDLLEYENHELITETSKATVATLMLLASSPSRVTNLRVDTYTQGVASLSWTPSPERGVTSYIVAYGAAADPMRRRIVVTEPRVTLPPLGVGSVVSVKAVNARGLEGWDWAKITLPAARPTSTRPTAVSVAARPDTR